MFVFPYYVFPGDAFGSVENISWNVPSYRDAAQSASLRSCAAPLERQWVSHEEAHHAHCCGRLSARSAISRAFMAPSNNRPLWATRFYLAMAHLRRIRELRPRATRTYTGVSGSPSEPWPDR